MTKAPIIFLVMLGSVLAGDDVRAQNYDLAPAHWFPLDLNSFWHYRYEDGPWIWNEVKKTDRDTLIDGERWTAMTTIYCDLPPYCPSRLPSTEWRRITEDGYLLSSVRDTVDALYPYSVFNVRTVTDRLYSWHDQDSVNVRIDSVGMGSVADTTYLNLVIEWLFPYSGSSYIYNIGQGYSLVGAVVAGLEYGETAFITRVSSERNPIDFTDISINVYPHPMRHGDSVRLSDMEAGSYSVTLYDILGRRVVDAYGVVTGRGSPVSWSWPDDLASGSYLLTVRTAQGQYASRVLVYLGGY